MRLGNFPCHGKENFPTTTVGSRDFFLSPDGGVGKFALPWYGKFPHPTLRAQKKIPALGGGGGENFGADVELFIFYVVISCGALSIDVGS